MEYQLALYRWFGSGYSNGFATKWSLALGDVGNDLTL